MAIESNLAGVARVAFEAETGEFNRDVSMAEQRYKKATEGMSDSAIRLELAQNRLHRALAKGPSNYQAIARAELSVRRETEALTRELKQNAMALDRSDRSLGRFTRGALVGSGALGRFGRTVGFASSMFLGGAGLAYAFTSTLKVAGEFQRSLNILQGVTKGTGAEIARASEEAKRLGRDVTLPATSAKDAAEAMTELAKAGFTMQDSIAGAEGVLRLAAAAGIEVDAAAKIASRSLNAFGLAGEDAGKVADLFAAVANAATGEIPDFGLALSQSSAVAKAWNVTINETVATLGVLANSAIIGSDAGTSFRVMLSRLVPVSKAAADKMEELGLSAFDGAGQIKPYRQILQEYHDVLVKLAPAQQKLAIQTIFGQDAQRFVNKVIVEGLPAYDKMLKKVGEVDAAQKLAAARNKGYVGALDAFRSAVETFQITLGTALLPTFTRALASATDWVNKMEKSGEATEQVKSAVEDAVEIFTALKDILGVIKAVADPVIEVLGGITRTIEIMAGLWVAMKIKSLISFGAMALASKTTSASMVADAAVAAAAWGAVPIGGTAPVPGPRGTTTRPSPTTRTPGRLGRMAPWLGALVGWQGAVAVGGIIAYKAASGTPSQAAGGFGEPVATTGDGRLIYRKDGKFYVNAPGPGAGARTTVRGAGGAPITMYRFDTAPKPGEIRAPGEGRAPAPAKRPPKRKRPGGAGGGAGGDGLTPIMRAEIASAEASTPGAELAAERTILSIYERELANTKLTGEKLKDLRIKVANQRKRVRDIEQAIETDAKNDREQRQRDYVERRGAEEQELRNAFDEALATPGRVDDRRAFIKLRNYLQARINDAKLSRDERAKARKRLNALRKEWTKENEEAVEDELDTQEKVLQNDIKAAELTEKNTKDDLKAHRRMRDFYKRRERDMDLSKEERQEYRGKRIDEQKEINRILKGDKENTDELRQQMQATFTDFAGFQHQFLTGMISQFLGGTGAGNALQTHALEQFTLQGNGHLAEIARTNRALLNRGGRRELDEALMP